MIFPQPTCDVPWIDTEQMIEVDRAMIVDYKIGLIQMMENAGRALAQVARQAFLDGTPRGRHIVVLAGTGGNGGGAITSARRLACWGASVSVVVTDQTRMTDIPDLQLDIVRRMNVPVHAPGALAALDRADLIIDGVIGYSLSGSPRGSAATMIQWANQEGAPILSLDAPSGLDTASGRVHDPAIRAAATMTLALPRIGLRSASGRQHVGELFLADIGVPPPLYAGPRLGLRVGAIFSESDVVSLCA